MAAKCKKCDPHEICEECPEWIFTLADLIMCMMGLFVLLWVLKPSPTPPALGSADGEPNKQQAKLVEQVAEIRAAFGYVPDPNSSDPVDQAMIKKSMTLRGPGEKGVQVERTDAAEGIDPTVQSIREGKLATVGTRVAFERGEARLTPDDLKNLNEIAKQIVGTRFVVVVKGHASRDDFETPTPPALMDVSLRRAQAAADYLVTQGVSPDVLRVQGCSTFEPVRQRAYTRDAHAMNRRVEVSSTDAVVRDLQDPNDASVAPLE
ncbi:MAG TPA: OmpA family protein [Tepidisphaeraceae bacterium]|jgi:outer membrane protein OmpA-like peptidoglycan-associated protein